MKVTVITTLLNERRTIEAFLEALLAQTRQADEIVICDGGSTDGTVEFLEQFIAKQPQISLVKHPGNIAAGRNAAIRQASSEVIAVTDVGTKADLVWLERLLAPFEAEPDTMVVSGMFKPQAETEFELISATQMLSDHDHIDPETWLPSSRSIAFKKAAWEKVEGYPEYLPFAGEDTLFDLNLKKAGFTFIFAPEAVVYWRPRTTPKAFFKQYFNYSYGDGLTVTSWQLYLKKVGMYAVGLGLMILGVFYSWALLIAIAGLLFYLYWKGRRVIGKYRRWSTVGFSFLITLLHDLADISGYTKGIWQRLVLRRYLPHPLAQS